MKNRLVFSIIWIHLFAVCSCLLLILFVYSLSLSPPELSCIPGSGLCCGATWGQLLMGWGHGGWSHSSWPAQLHSWARCSRGNALEHAHPGQADPGGSWRSFWDSPARPGGAAGRGRGQLPGKLGKGTGCRERSSGCSCFCWHLLSLPEPLLKDRLQRHRFPSSSNVPLSLRLFSQESEHYVFGNISSARQLFFKRHPL